MDAEPKSLLIQQQALHIIAKLALKHQGDWHAFLKDILPIAADVMNVAQVSVWMLKNSNSLLICEELYRADLQEFSSGHILRARDYPKYFTALYDGRAIDAHDANHDPRTREFAETYLKPQDISSMLDAALKKEGEVIGIICFEHIGPMIHWEETQIGFASAIADQINLLLLHQDMQKAALRTQQSEKRFRIAAEMTNDILVDWRPDHNLLYISPILESTLRHSSQTIFSVDQLIQLIHPDDRHLISCHTMSQDIDTACEVRIQHANGHWVWTKLRLRALRSKDQVLESILGVFSIIDERKRYEQQLEYEATHDALTGLPNRSDGINQIQKLLDLRKPGASFALLYMDLDRFKLINDSLGHNTGDRVLRIFSQTLIHNTNDQTYIARLGGDEFIIILHQVSSESEARQQVHQLKQACAKPVMIDGREFHLAASIGIAISNPDYHKAEDMLADADMAMYASKKAGSVPMLFHESMKTDITSRLHLEQELKRASISHHFEIHYQPILRTEDLQLKGLEALIRWRHPQRGLMSPGEFLDIADESGMIIPLGYWMLHEICKDIHLINDLISTEAGQQAPWISINLSATQLGHSALFDQIQDALEIHHVEPRQLKLEISESAGGDDLYLLQQVHDRLCELQIGLLIDDFGTGHSSLARLREFKFESIKIDRSILGEPEETENNIEFLQAVISIASAMGTETILEGVEVKDQMTLANSMGTDCVQGYYLGRPSQNWNQWIHPKQDHQG